MSFINNNTFTVTKTSKKEVSNNQQLRQEASTIRKFDVVIISKDRHGLLQRQVNRIRKNFPYRKIIVVEGSENLAPEYEAWLRKRVILRHSPNAKLGYARQLGLEECNTEHIFMLYDDIEFEKGFAEACYEELIKIPDAFALSPIIVFGDDPVIVELFQSIKKDRESVSGGCCIINRELLNSIGGYMDEVHIGEDAELFYRAKKYGYKWVRKVGVYAYHPATVTQFLLRTWHHREGHLISVTYGYKAYTDLILDQIKGITVNYLRIIKTGKIRLNMHLLASNLIALVTAIRVIIGGDNYAFYKKKIA